MNDLSKLMFHLIASGTEEAGAAGHGGEHAAHHATSYWATMALTGLTLFVIGFLLVKAKSGFTNRTFRGVISQSSEQLYLFIENMCLGTIGSHGRKYVPMIFSFWLIIFFSNVVSLFVGASPTSVLSFNLGMALVSIGYVQYEGIKSNGVIGHFSHFAGPKLGGPLVIISAMIFVIEIISEVMKNVSLSLRLFGNINGGHQAVDAMNKISFLPLGELLIPIKLLTCLVQAMIFCLLTCVYLSLVTHHDEDHGHDGHGELAAAH